MVFKDGELAGQKVGAAPKGELAGSGSPVSPAEPNHPGMDFLASCRDYRCRFRQSSVRDMPISWLKRLTGASAASSNGDANSVEQTMAADDSTKTRFRNSLCPERFGASLAD